MSTNVLDVLLWPFKHNFLNFFVEYITKMKHIYTYVQQRPAEVYIPDKIVSEHRSNCLKSDIFEDIAEH